MVKNSSSNKKLGALLIFFGCESSRQTLFTFMFFSGLCTSTSINRYTFNIISKYDVKQKKL